MNWSLFRALIVTVCFVTSIPASAGAAPIPGVFALQGKSQATSAALTVSSVKGDPLARQLDIAFTQPGVRAPMRSFDLDMTKYIHLIIINDDFTLFQHVHPELEKNGHFRIVQRFPFPGMYHLYADVQPHGLSQQVFRFDLQVGHPRIASTARRDLNETHGTAIVGGYSVALSTMTLRAGSETMFTVTITKNGKPADLKPYLGALAHAVFINGEDLTYAHVHPMSAAMMSGMTMGPGTMMLHVGIQEPGTYKLWLQFNGASGLLVAPFVLTAQ